MTTLALRSLRHRATAQTATFLAVLLGTILIGSFATLAETSGASGISDADAETLVIMGSVVGVWGAAIALFAIVSTLGTTVRQRTTEIGLLRTIGATPRQVGRLIRAEVLAISVIAATAGAALSLVTGRALLAMIRGHLVSDSVDFGGTAMSTGSTAVAVVVVALVAAVIASRKATSAPPTLVARSGETETSRLPRWRVAIALILIVVGLSEIVVTITVSANADDPNMAMITSAYSSILIGLGFAMLAPMLLRWFAPLLRPLLGRGASAHLAGQHTTRRAHLLSGVLAPVTILTSTAVGILMMVGIDTRTLHEGNPEQDTINLLNNVVVGMLVLFASIMVINALVAMMAHRRAEFRQLWLIGATSGQVRRTVVSEAIAVAGLGVVLGIAAGLCTAVPFAIARDEGIVPDGQLWLPLVIAVGVVGLTIGASRTAVSREIKAAR